METFTGIFQVNPRQALQGGSVPPNLLQVATGQVPFFQIPVWRYKSPASLYPGLSRMSQQFLHVLVHPPPPQGPRHAASSRWFSTPRESSQS